MRTLLLLLIALPLFAEPDFGKPEPLTFSTQEGQLYGGAGCYTKFALWPEIISLMNDGLKGTQYEGMFTGVQTFCSDYPIHCDNWQKPYLTNQNGAVGIGNLKRFGRSIGNLCDQFMWTRDYNTYNSKRANFFERRFKKVRRRWKRLRNKCN